MNLASPIGDVPASTRKPRADATAMRPPSSPQPGPNPFDFIETVRRLDTPREIVETMRAALSGFGVEYLCFNFLPGSTENFKDLLLASRLPAGWIELYNEKQFVHADPSIRYCKRMLRPYRWVKEAPYDPEREPRALEVVQRAADFGMLDGLVIPIARPAAEAGHVWAGGRALSFEERELPAIHLMALYAFDRVLQLRRPLASPEPGLTPREQEVLTWAALGKPAWEIGKILKISARTANAHIVNARQKLGAVNRTQAVMIALRDRIIQP